MVEVISGTQTKVDHPEPSVIRTDVAVYLSAEGVPSFFDRDSAAQATDVAGQWAV